MLKGVLIKARAYNTELTREVGCAISQVLFTRNVVEMYPFSVLGGQDTLCTKYHSEATRHYFVKTFFDEFHRELICGFYSPT